MQPNPENHKTRRDYPHTDNEPQSADKDVGTKYSIIGPNTKTTLGVLISCILVTIAASGGYYSLKDDNRKLLVELAQVKQQLDVLQRHCEMDWTRLEMKVWAREMKVANSNMVMVDPDDVLTTTKRF
jgi:uncharacterized protein HemX